MSPCVLAQSGAVSPDRTSHSLGSAPSSAASGPRVGTHDVSSKTPAAGGPHRQRARRGIAHPPKADTGHGMLREAPLSATESRIIHDPSDRANGAMTGIPATHGSVPLSAPERRAGATD